MNWKHRPNVMLLTAKCTISSTENVPSTSPWSFKRVQRSLFKIKLWKNNVLFFTPQAHQHLCRADLPEPATWFGAKSSKEWRLVGSFSDLIGSTACPKHPVFLDRSGAPKPHMVHESSVAPHLWAVWQDDTRTRLATRKDICLRAPREAGWYTLNPQLA